MMRSGSMNVFLTADELAVVKMLAEVYEAFIRLPVQHPMHQQEFTMAVHQAQRLVLSRPVTRALGETQEQS